MTVYSVQQIKFEFLSYIKEFGGAEGWLIGVCDDPEQTLFDSGMVDAQADIWLWKPALNAGAAGKVLDYFQQRFQIPGASAPPGMEEANCVFLYRKGERMMGAQQS
ncbi:hypothetical protein [Pseudomonas bohemica]|uniref:hypothetical protein n=1 Tax=Pseudomonas bohemica TaxID=2044872 RepID=UPI000DA60020|nr:hypothetical protein [Pseudomonas bohemica]